MVLGIPKVYVRCLYLISIFSLFFVTSAYPFQLSNEEQDYIQQNNTIIFISQTRYAPFEFVDKGGQHEGMMLDVIRWLAMEIGFKPVFTNSSFKEAQEAVLAGRADIITSLFFSEKRNQTFEFTHTLFDVPASIFIQADRTDIKNINNLSGKTIAIQKGDYARDFLENKNIEFKILETDDFGEATNMVIAGKADAVIGDEQIVLHHLFTNRLTRKIKRIGEPLYTGKDCMAAAKRNKLLIQILNKGIEEARSTGVLDKITKKWLGSETRAQGIIDMKYIWALLIAAGLILLLSIWVYAWNVRLKKIVNKKTEHIKQSGNALQKSEQKLNRILSSSPVALSIIEKKEIKWVNESWIKMFGTENEDEHIGQPIIGVPHWGSPAWAW